jgi:DNA-binding MarR family transcriptional regulator
MKISSSEKEVVLSEKLKMIFDSIELANYLRYVTEKELKQKGVSLEQYYSMKIIELYHPEPVKVIEIQKRMLDKTSNVSRLIDKLYKKGYVERKTASYDRRACEITLTDEGLKLVKELDEKLKSWQSDLKILDKNLAKPIKEQLQKIKENL